MTPQEIRQVLSTSVLVLQCPHARALGARTVTCNEGRLTMPNTSVASMQARKACHRLLSPTRFLSRWMVLLAGLTMSSHAIAAVFGVNTSYSYSGFLADFQGHRPAISKSDAASTIGYKDFLPAAVGDESSFSGPLGTTASATAAAHATGGILGVAVTGKVDASQAPSGVSLNVYAQASLFDIFTVNMDNPAMLGKTVHIANEMPLKGFMSHQIYYAIPPGQSKGNDFVDSGAETALQITGTGIAPGPYGGSLYAADEEGANVTQGFTRINDPAPQTVSFAMDFVVGTPTPVFIKMELGGTANVDNHDALTHFPGGASFTVDFSHTLAWGPVTTVTDPTTGEVITGWTISAASGFNYGNPVPVPSSAALMASGTFIIGIWHRRRARCMAGIAATRTHA